MTTYAVKLGEILLKSGKPITDEQRRRMVELLKKEDGTLLIDGDLEVVLTVQRDYLKAPRPKVR